MTFSKGSLILVDYTAKIKDSEKIFDTTIKEVAEKHSIYEQHLQYQPKLISIGEVSYPVLTGLDEALAKTTVGDKLTIEVTPDKGFGERDSRKIRMIPIRKLGDDADKVSVGDSVEIDNKIGIIRYIGSGRVQIDYNHKHAGKTILFDVNVIKSLDTPNDKIDSILKNRLSVDATKVVFDLKDNEASITVPKEIFRIEGLQMTKHFIQLDIFKFVPILEKISFVETYANKQSLEMKSQPKEETTQPKEETTQPKEETTQPKEETPKPETA